MTIVTALYIAALICGLIDEAQTLGRSILGYAVILMAIGLLWGRLG